MSDVLNNRDFALIAAQSRLHQHYFIGMQLMVATRETPKVVEEWMYELFYRQHDEKFLSSFKKLGLEGESAAVASAKYHVLANGVGGLQVDYMYESDAKAWIRYRYPRWFADGPAICGIPVEASTGFMRGWHARNGLSLNNPRLGFVCVSEDMTGEFGLCGYFREFDHELSDQERLQYARGERPPPFDPAIQPQPPASQWNTERLAKAGRNYAVEFVRNGIIALTKVVGRQRGTELAARAARLIGLQHYVHLARTVGARDAGVAEAAQFLAAMFEGMGDAVEVEHDDSRHIATIRQQGLRVARGLNAANREDVLQCWVELWKGAMASQRAFMSLEAQTEEQSITWTLGLS